MSLKTITGSIPVYRADRSLYAQVGEQRLERLQSAGLVARVVRSRKGDIKRVILFAPPGEPKPPGAGAYLGTRYSFREHLDSGYRVWALKRLGRQTERSEPIATIT